MFRGPGASGGNYARNGFARLLTGEPTCNVYVLPGATAVSIERLE
ncbi:hypothetical protein OM076_08020 [Solirubrobacter ginsenosidimutans]|uniref:Uncharacterized protein n=1 Tax=Solirubrobacter ginsenosidimutans TaxID=490573 RepID=A0A9X3MS71_9ACTN|nr:hypothetical protein [Solirubrobacter ginsenosidimutans]MDA0160205.1 hypothetical protein [Solirubrobacter ginsenosidimutans]